MDWFSVKEGFLGIMTGDHVGICIGICGYETSLNARRHLPLS